jgi:pSer/pThr/pTyr-binding forkhead associated (FHA) protein
VVVIVTEEGRQSLSMVFDKDQIDIGRDNSCDIVLPASNVSSRHARMFMRDNKVIIRDLGSTNGTTVNGRRLERPQLLQPRDVVRIGNYLLKLGDAQAGPWA